ncbi:MAG: divalent-cation tolerance protein CutA [Bdellovibrionales bacterium]|nr:divalent-cation tolerance protein CutA [Bdellovibrionales bacterium]
MASKVSQTRLIFVYVTTPNERIALEIAKTAINEKLGACANILPEMKSVYEWQGNLCEESETLLIIRRRLHYNELDKKVLELHPHECPCIVALPIQDGHSKFLSWIEKQTS